MVIAIIGVLAAVLIPTFSGAIDSARQASDKSDVTHMNQELMIYKIQENVSSVDYHSALLWLTTNGYSLESSAKGYAYWFDEDAEQLVYAQVDEAISNANVASATGDGTDGIYDDPGKIAANKNLTLIDRRTDNPIITAVNGIRNLVQEASSVGSAAGDINAQLATSFTAIVNAAGNDTVKTYLNNFAPDKTLYITENGVYTGLTGTATTASAVVFSDTLRVIDKSTTGDTAAYQVQDGAVINLPHTVALVMENALSCIVPASGGTVKVTAEKAQFLDNSLSSEVQTDSEITTIGALDELTGSGGSINYTVQYTYREALVEYKKSGATIQQTIRQKLSEDDQTTVNNAMTAAENGNPLTTAANVLTGTVTDYLTDELLKTKGYENVTTDGAKVLREYLVPTFKFTGSFANVSGIDIQMKKDGDLTIFYGITYGKNGTISQIVTFGFWSDASVGFTDQKKDQNNESFYQYTASDPLRGYTFDNFYGELIVTAYYTGTLYDPNAEADEEENGTTTEPAVQTADSPVTQTSIELKWIEADNLYRSMKEEDATVAQYFNQRPDKFTVSSNGLVLYAEYIQQETTASGNTEA